MKLKGLLKGLCIFGLTLLPISFSNAVNWNDVSCYEYEGLSTNNVYGNTILTFNNGNFATQRGSESIQNVLWLTRNGYNSSSNDQGYWLSSSFGYIDGKPYLYAGYYGGNYQGFVENVCVESLSTFDLSTFGSNLNGCELFDINSFLVNKNIIGGGYCYPNSENNYAYAPFTYCFYTSSNAYCFKLNSYASSTPSYRVNTLSGSIGLTTPLTVSKLNNVSRSPSPFDSSNISPTYYYSTGSCPSVGQLKAGSNLTPAVCYGGYDGDLIYTAGENTTIQAGSGLNLFEIYELFSGNMNIQDWYDTYRTYYNNISFNPYPFYNKPKALLGLMVARQTAGLTRGYNGSYFILNYCYYVLNNVPDNISTCVGSSVSTQYSGIILTDQDYKDLIDMVNDNYVVHRPGSGSIFNGSGGFGGGGSAWGDDECTGIPCLFEKFYQMFTSSKVNDVEFKGNGILPSYIALAFVVVVLFYVFKR